MFKAKSIKNILNSTNRFWTSSQPKYLLSTSSLQNYQNKTDLATKLDDERSEENVSRLAANLRHKPLKNEPFIKNLFRGQFIFDYLKFPEYESNYELEKLNQNHVQPLHNYLQKSKYDEIIDSSSGRFTSQAFHSFKQLGLFSSSLSKEFDGNELDSTSVARVLEETGVYPALGIGLIYNSEIVAKSVQMYGSQEQKNAYLKRLSSGELKAGFCYSEPDNGLDASRFKCLSSVKNPQADLDKQVYVLNGKKSWVTLLTDRENIEHENALFLVVATTVNTVEQNEPDLTRTTVDDFKNLATEKCLNAFLVDKNAKGVKVHRQHTNNSGLNLYEIEFDHVELDASRLLGSPNSGFEISSQLIENARYLVGALSLGLIKNLYKTTVEFVVNSKRFGKSLSDFLAIKEKLANIETRIYTMESMVYLTAGILDSYQQADVGCESALTKIYCTEAMRSCAQQCMDILATAAYTPKLDQIKQRYTQDMSYLTNVLNTNDLLKIYVATSGVVMAGMEFSDEVGKLRNPFMYPGFVLKQLFTNHRLVKSSSKKQPEYFYLWEHVHPSFREPASILEQLCIRFMMAVKGALVNHGRDIVEYQFSLRHLSEICVELYALNAAIARASRSYSIGLPNSQHEMNMAFVQAKHAKNIVEHLHAEIVNSRFGPSLEGTKVTIADQVIQKKQHAAEHAISRNY